jgi:hypothetical protein
MVIKRLKRKGEVHLYVSYCIYFASVWQFPFSSLFFFFFFHIDLFCNKNEFF